MTNTVTLAPNRRYALSLGFGAVIAVAKMNDGSFYMTRKQVKVAIGGCCS